MPAALHTHTRTHAHARRRTQRAYLLGWYWQRVGRECVCGSPARDQQLLGVRARQGLDTIGVGVLGPNARHRPAKGRGPARRAREGTTLSFYDELRRKGVAAAHHCCQRCQSSRISSLPLRRVEPPVLTICSSFEPPPVATCSHSPSLCQSIESGVAESGGLEQPTDRHVFVSLTSITAKQPAAVSQSSQRERGRESQRERGRESEREIARLGRVRPPRRIHRLARN